MHEDFLVLPEMESDQNFKWSRWDYFPQSKVLEGAELYPK